MLKLTEMVQLGAAGFKPADIKKFGESGIESKDIIELAKSGYTANDVDELIKLSQETAGSTAAPSTDEQPPEGNPGAGSDDAGDDNNKPDPKDDEIEKLKKTIEDIQNKNAYQNLGQEKETLTNQQKVDEIFRNLF